MIYHLTDINNVENIIKMGLLSRKTLLEKGLTFEDVADAEILEFRKLHNLNECVPFHFFSNNPFDGCVQKNHSNNKYVYFCIYRNVAMNAGFQIIPKHPLHMQPFQIYNYDKGMSIIDWDTMELRDYSNYECKEICMAECIYRGDVTLDLICSIHVKTKEDQEYVQSLLKKYKKSAIKVQLSPNYFVR